MKVKCNKIEGCGTAYRCKHATPHEKGLMCDPGWCVFLHSRAECLPLDAEVKEKQ